MLGEVTIATGVNAAAVTLPTTVETACATVLGTPSIPSTVALVHGHVIVQAGTGATSIQIQIRQGTGVTGTSIYSSGLITATAGGIYALPFAAQDTPGNVEDMNYTVTVQQGGATGPGSAVHAVISCLFHT